MAITSGLREFIIRRNLEQSSDFSSAEARLERQRYRALHPTEIIALKCMDGRLNLAIYTQTPPGIIQPFRNIGGRFDLGWPFFQEVMRNSVNHVVSTGRRSLVLITYHFSKGDVHRGCAGFGYDTEGARKNALKLCQQFESVFGIGSRVVYPVVVGIETDDESLIFHSGEKVLEVAKLEGTENLAHTVRSLYPDMDYQMVNDLIPLLEGNYRHIEEVRKHGKELIDHEHREQVIAVGRGFDWLHMPNVALIIGPYSHDWQQAVVTAGKIVMSNIEGKRIPKEHGSLLFVAALARDQMGSFGWNMAQEKARNLMMSAKKNACC